MYQKISDRKYHSEDQNFLTPVEPVHVPCKSTMCDSSQGSCPTLPAPQICGTCPLAKCRSRPLNINATRVAQIQIKINCILKEKSSNAWALTLLLRFSTIQVRELRTQNGKGKQTRSSEWRNCLQALGSGRIFRGSSSWRHWVMLNGT